MTKDERLDNEYGLIDYLQLMSWYAMLALFINIWGWFFGLIAYGVSVNVIALLLKVIFNLEMMSGADELFFQEDARNSANIVAFQKYDKFDAEVFA